MKYFVLLIVFAASSFGGLWLDGIKRSGPYTVVDKCGEFSEEFQLTRNFQCKASKTEYGWPFVTKVTHVLAAQDNLELSMVDRSIDTYQKRVVGGTFKNYSSYNILVAVGLSLFLAWLINAWLETRDFTFIR